MYSVPIYVMHTHTYLTWYPILLFNHHQHRFRREYREERLGTSTSPVQRAFDAASSNIIMILFLLIGFISATIACLPLLLLLKAASYVVCGSSYHDGALEACHDGALEEGVEGSSFVERSLVSLIGSFTSDETAKYKEQVVTPLI